MKSVQKQYLLAAGLLAVCLAGSAVAGDIGTTVKNACTACHSSKRICLNIGVKDVGAWKATVARMVGNGARLAGGEIDAAANYLGGLKPGSSPLCN